MTFERNILLNVSIEQAWQLLGPDYGKACEWAPGVHGSSLVGKTATGDTPTHRACATDFGDIKEQVTEYAPENYALAYVVTEGFPGMIKEGRNRWQLHQEGPNRTRLTMNMTINTGGLIGTLMRPLMKMQLGKVADQAVEGFKAYVETGKPSKAKTKEAKKRRPVAMAA